ncbi:hypothetical protein [Spirosoma montaniterrae]|uniref:DUF4890 domain-containing protein n=1 Tax=Spirosoma montaniterrae TaxID=1178516 RepID=A0A1P9X2W1_9BACT|nr:hypothetical protein [Spirosoma montaniterrae]AQG81935.1 hypothetical protein AWR27_23145 [Spirosoma montaniterrae]
MNTKTIAAVAIALFLSVGAYAQNPTPSSKPHLTPEQRAARKADRKAKLAQMSPEERKAFKQTHREQRQARLNAMTPEQRDRVMRRKEARRAAKGKA